VRTFAPESAYYSADTHEQIFFQQLGCFPGQQVVYPLAPASVYIQTTVAGYTQNSVEVKTQVESAVTWSTKRPSHPRPSTPSLVSSSCDELTAHSPPREDLMGVPLNIDRKFKKLVEVQSTKENMAGETSAM
jgi:hypothetical protein